MAWTTIHYPCHAPRAARFAPTAIRSVQIWAMIRNVVLVKLKAGQDPAVVAKAQQAFLDLNCPGTLSYTIGNDLGLREGNWSFAIVADFTDAEAYRAYDHDPEHNQARAGLIRLTEQIARIQFEMP